MVTVGKQFEKNFAMICFLLSPSGGKRKTHFSLQNSERPFCLPTVTHSPPVSAIMALNIMYRQKKTDGNRPRLPSVSVAFFVHNEQSIAVIRVVGLCNMLKLTIFQRKSQNIIDIYNYFKEVVLVYRFRHIIFIQDRNASDLHSVQQIDRSACLCPLCDRRLCLLR